MAHIHEKIDFTVTAFIVHERSVLLVDHIKLKRWLPVGGHVELDEHPEEALFREVEEESGIGREHLTVYGQKPDLESEGTVFLYAPTYLDIHRIDEVHQHIGMTYFLGSDTDQISLAAGEHNGIQWFTEEMLDDTQFKISKAVRFYAGEAIEKLS